MDNLHNIIDKNGKITFEKRLLDKIGNHYTLPKVFQEQWCNRVLTSIAEAYEPSDSDPGKVMKKKNSFDHLIKEIEREDLINEREEEK